MREEITVTLKCISHWQLVYWVITFVLERVISYLEKKLRIPEDAPALLDIRDTEVE